MRFAVSLIEKAKAPVLVIGAGANRKLCGRMLDASKIYQFTLAFGTETSGLDTVTDRLLAVGAVNEGEL